MEVNKLSFERLNKMWKNLKAFADEVAAIPTHIKEVTTEEIDVETPEEYTRNTYDSQLDEVSL